MGPCVIGNKFRKSLHCGKNIQAHNLRLQKWSQRAHCAYLHAWSACGFAVLSNGCLDILQSIVLGFRNLFQHIVVGEHLLYPTDRSTLIAVDNTHLHGVAIAGIRGHLQQRDLPTESRQAFDKRTAASAACTRWVALFWG